eukprot:m.107377 g.107377  ORF g.107377 m.107377 type:complete len:489 (+) comp15314_c0_seq4:2538-4004(+)
MAVQPIQHFLVPSEELLERHVSLAEASTEDSTAHAGTALQRLGGAISLLLEDAWVAPQGNTPLHRASQLNLPDVVQALLAAGHDVSATNHNNQTSLHIAVSEGASACVELLLQQNAIALRPQRLLQAHDQNGNTAMDLAANSVLMFFRLADELPSMSIYAPTSALATFYIKIHDAWKFGGLNGLESAVQSLKVHDPWTIRNVFDPENKLASSLLLCLGVFVDDIKLVRLALRREADCNEQFNELVESKCSAVHWCCMLGRSQILWCLLRHNQANPLLVNIHNENACHMASQRGWIKCVKMLILWGRRHRRLFALTETKNRNGHTTLHLASEGLRLAIVDTLLNWGADPDARDDEGNLPIHLAALQGRLDICKRLLASRENGLDARNAEGYTPLYFAVKNGHLELVTVFLKRGANPTCPTNLRRCTPAHYASHNNDVAMLQLLTRHGADLTVRNMRGNTPHGVAEEEDCRDAADFLSGLEAALPTDNSA